jgi:hypothetical protein
VIAIALVPPGAFTLGSLSAEWTGVLFAPETDVSIIMTVGQRSCEPRLRPDLASMTEKQPGSGHWPVSVDDVFDRFLLSVRHTIG